MNVLRNTRLLLIVSVLFLLVPAVSADMMLSASPSALHLPASEWWLVLHNQCDDTLHWINPTGEFASIPRPKLPDEAPGSPCSYRPMHISQDGRFMVQTGLLTSGRTGVGFYDLQTGAWLQVHQTEANEAAFLGHRYSSDVNNQIAISFSTELEGAHAWRVGLFDMATGNPVDELRSDGTEIASFVGGEFLADAVTVPYTVLLSQDETTSTPLVVIRFDVPEDDPLGAVIWYPEGAPGVDQELISSAYRTEDLDILPNGDAIYAYEEAGFAAGPPAGEGPSPITSNAVALLRPDPLGDSPDPELFFADGVSTVYGPQWAADGRIALFRRFDGTTEHLHWIKVGTAVLVPLEQQIGQILGVPTGFVYNTADGIFYLSETAASPTGPIFTDPALSGSMAFVWATAFGNPPLTLDSIASAAPEAIPTLPIVTATPDTGICRIRSADNSNVNMRSGPGTAYPVLAQVPGTTELAVIGYNGDWYVVNYGGVQGWMAGWVSTLLGNCTGLTFVAAPPPPATEVPSSATISLWADTTTIAAGGCANIFWQVENISEVYFEGTGVTGSGSQNVCPAATTTYTLTVTLLDGTTQTRTITITVGGGGGAAQPDLFVSEFALDPATPVQDQPVNVRVGIYNQGTAAVSGTSFHIEWYPGENYPSPACTWDLDSMNAGGGRILTCTYAGYPSWYSSINTKVVVDTYNAVSESNEGNNSLIRTISVSQPGGGGAGQPDLYVSEFSLDPATPVQGQAVNVRVGVYNQGTAAVSGTSFHIEWYPGENYPSPACTWDLDSMNANGGRILTCTYAGYPSWYGSINTKVVVDTYNAVSESNEGNNVLIRGISVSAP